MPPAPPTPPSLLASLLNISLGVGVSDLSVANNSSITGAGNDTIVGGDSVTANLSGGADNITTHDSGSLTINGGANKITVHDKAAISITGGGNSVTMHDNGSLTINDARSVAASATGSVTFGDTLSYHNNDTIALNYSLALGNSASVSVNFNPTLNAQAGAGGDQITDNFLINAGNSDLVNFNGANQAITLNAGGADTVSTAGANDTITIGNSATAGASAATQAATGGACTNGIVLNVGATAAGTTFDGGLGTDTFTAGMGYDGGNHYIGSMGDQAQLFAGTGNCMNYSGLQCSVVVNYNTGIGQGFDASGKLLWTDTYTNMEQVKGAQLDGNVLTGSNAYFNELKGGLGQTTYHDGAGGDRIIWGEAGATGLVDGQGTDIAYLGNGTDELYWRNQPMNSKGVSNFGETVYGYQTKDDFNFSELANSRYSGVSHSFGGVADLSNWVQVELASNGVDTLMQFDKTGTGSDFQTAATLKGVNLFTDYGVANNPAGAAQVLQDMYAGGSLVFTMPH